MYSSYKSLVRYMICRYFPPFCGLSLNFLMVSFQTHKCIFVSMMDLLFFFKFSFSFLFFFLAQTHKFLILMKSCAVLSQLSHVLPEQLILCLYHEGREKRGERERWEGRDIKSYGNICGIWDKRFETILCKVLASVLQVWIHFKWK